MNTVQVVQNVQADQTPSLILPRDAGEETDRGSGNAAGLESGITTETA